MLSLYNNKLYLGLQLFYEFPWKYICGSTSSLSYMKTKTSISFDLYSLICDLRNIGSYLSSAT